MQLKAACVAATLLVASLPAGGCIAVLHALCSQEAPDCLPSVVLFVAALANTLSIGEEDAAGMGQTVKQAMVAGRGTVWS